MRKKFLALGLSGLLGVMGLLQSCETNKSPLDSNASFEFPMQLGNRWEYKRTLTAATISSDSLIIDTTIVSQIELEVTQLMEMNPPLYELREILTESGNEYTDYAYYQNLEDGLYYTAYRGAGFVIPKNAKNGAVSINGRRFQSVREFINTLTKQSTLQGISSDTLIYENPPLLSIQYPLEVGAQWTYRTAGNPWRIDKKVVGYAPVTVPAGTFMSFQIQWLIDLNDDGQWDDNIIFYDYISAKGLIKRDITLKNVAFYTEGNPDPVGFYDSREISVLTDAHLR